MRLQSTFQSVALSARQIAPPRLGDRASLLASCVLTALVAGIAWAGTEAQVRPTSGSAAPTAVAGPASGELIGIVFARRALDLEAEIEGQVAEIVVELGQHVNRDRVLLKLASPWLEHELVIVRASVATAQAELDQAILERDLAVQKRERRLQAPDAWSAEERAEIQFAADMAQVQVSLAKAQLEGNQAKADQLAEQLARATVRAPFAGVLSGRYCELGERVAVNSPLLRLISDADLQVRFGIPENLVGRVTLGSDLEAHFPVLNLTVPLKISRLAPEIDLATGMATAEGTLATPPAMQTRVWPGMTVKVLIP